MNDEQLGTLNSLVTFAAENVPGGLSKEEREVAQIVAGWLSEGSMQTHIYKIVGVSIYLYGTIENAANKMAKRGWRVVGVVSGCGPSYIDQLILERPVGVTHPDD